MILAAICSLFLLDKGFLQIEGFPNRFFIWQNPKIKYGVIICHHYDIAGFSLFSKTSNVVRHEKILLPLHQKFKRSVNQNIFL